MGVGMIVLLIIGGMSIERKYRMLPVSSNSDSKVAHISFDDVIMVLKDLTDYSDRYESVFDYPFLKDLKELQDTYGAKFTLFIFEQTPDFDISEMPQKFKKEFKANASWLKFGFHGKKPTGNKNRDAGEFSRSFCHVLDRIGEFADTSCISSVLRLDYYYATDHMIEVMKRTHRVSGLLCADDERVSYNLTPEENNRLQQQFFLEKGLKYFKTNLRYEDVWSIDYSLALLQNRDTLILFTHEWAYTPQTPLQWISRKLAKPALQANWRTRQKVRESIKWLKKHNYRFDFLE